MLNCLERPAADATLGEYAPALATACRFTGDSASESDAIPVGVLKPDGANGRGQRGLVVPTGQHLMLLPPITALLPKAAEAVVLVSVGDLLVEVGV
mmetsp:Transcript_75645/g.162231  ORF Transcript_75645/g.162231 Transcript_75645/m.162231 type:complete len:96 (+) Transcript_75645:186-473(+)